MSSKINVLMLGATGYIGGSLLSLFLEREDFASFNITAVVRSAEKADKMKSLGINIIVGSHSDPVLMERIAQENEVVFSMGDADNAVGVEAILKGFKKQFLETGKIPIFIHTSGTGTLFHCIPPGDSGRAANKTEGVIATPGNGFLEDSSTIYDDSNVEQMAGIPVSKIHRSIDLSIVAADTEGYVKACIVIPGTIYGIAKTRLTELGVQNAHSYTISRFINVSLHRGKAAIIGDGGNIWPHVSLEDMSRLYIQLYDSLVSDPSTGHGTGGYYFGENGEFTLLEIAQKVGEVLFELNIADTPDAEPLSPVEIAQYFKGAKASYLSSNCRCRGTRSRSIGWTPTGTIDDFFASVKSDVECAVAGAVRH